MPKLKMFWKIFCISLFGTALLLILAGCQTSNLSTTLTKTIILFDNKEIPASMGISKDFVSIDGYNYVNVFVEFEQKDADENPVSLGVLFALNPEGKLLSRRYFSFDQNFIEPTDPQFIDVSGKDSWHGSPHNRSSYIVRLPVMGPYMKVIPMNRHTSPRHITVACYLTR